MTISNTMKVTIRTLIDITETRKHKHNEVDKQLIYQQANFASFFNCLSMRFNPYYDVSPICTEQDVTGVFGTDFKGTHKVWDFEFEVETAVAGTDLMTLKDDFDLVPVIANLTETINTDNKAFRTKNKKKCNIVFNILPDNAE
jgi:hypothetical protein